MAQTKVAGRYAKSLLGLAIERKAESKINADMELVQNTIAGNREFELLLKNPIINTDKKINIINSIFKGKVDDITLSFLNIITNKKREFYIDDIASQFIALYKAHVNIETAIVTSAVKLDDKLRADVMTIVKKIAKGTVELKEKIDKDLIGGFVLTIKDKQYDASIESKLRELRKDMKINLYKKNY